MVGKLPMEFGSLGKLQWLQINVNNLTGRIPASIWNLSSLIVLSLAYNNLEGDIPEDIGRLKNLTTIAVPGNKLSGMFPPSLYNISSLTFISAAVNEFNGSLPANIFLTLPNLQVFGIGGNQFSGPIPASIVNASVLQILDISQNHFVGQVPSLGKLQDLWWLNLGINDFGGYPAKDSEFLESLQNCSKLKILDITSNNFGGPLPNTLGNFSTQLSELYLGGNLLSGKIPATLGNLINLYILGMGNNNFTEAIPATFGNFQNMQLLDLRGNKLSGQIPAIMGSLSQLFELRLSENMLEGNIPPSIGNCQNLRSLDLSKNKLGGVIPPEVIGLSSLTILLNLSQNSLTGSLPAEVGRLKDVGKLDVSKNHLTGEIPATIGTCIGLEYLNVQGNSFHGIIPASLALLKGLQHLDLSRNNLTGLIPEGLQDISFLQYLNVSFNMLEGEVPIKGVFRNASAIALTRNSKLCGGISELQLPPCAGKVVKQRKRHNLKLIAVIFCVLVLLLLLSSIFAIFQVRKRKTKSSPDSPTIDLLSKVSYQSLYTATDGFSASNLIGSGGFGSVYRGTLESEEVVAIQVFNLEKKGAHKSFIAECNALKNIRHRNLVKVLTCCSSTDYKGCDFKALVFYYMTNGSLEEWLHTSTNCVDERRALDLDQRLNIVIDVASALRYLHYECEQPVVHCDLNPSNVLLDGEMVAHVSDFGLARLLLTINDISHMQTITTGINGTIGYTPPEYGMGSAVSTQGDMYSFGILVLEMLTARRPTEDMFKDGHNLHNYVKIAFPNKVLQILDQTILSLELEQKKAATKDNRENLEKCLISLFRIGLACSVESPKERMNMMDVCKELNLIKNIFLSGGINGD